MSTTLKALQRLEKIKSRPESHNAAANGPGLAHHGEKRFQGRRTWLSKTGLMVVLAVAGLLAVFLLFAGSPLKITRRAALLPSEPPESVETTVAASIHSMPQTDEHIMPPASPLSSPVAESVPDGIVPSPERPVLPWRGEGINVQAIVAGSNPDASLAVINNATVHRGDRVGGDYVVAAIETDAVIVSRGGERWRVPFGR